MTTNNLIMVICLIAFFGLLAVGAIAAFIYSIVEQKKYNSVSLPSLEEEKEPEPDPEDQELIPESRFIIDEDLPDLQDEESKNLMNSLKAIEEPKKPFGNLLKKKEEQ